MNLDVLYALLAMQACRKHAIYQPSAAVADDVHSAFSGLVSQAELDFRRSLKKLKNPGSLADDS